MAMPLVHEDQARARPRDELRSVESVTELDSAAKARMRILVVDDEHTLRESCAMVLRQEGYEVTVCGRGQEARECLERRAFDVVLLDLYMSGVDGLTLLRTALATNPATLVVVMTGKPSVETSVEALRHGAWDYLPKPFSASHLHILIGRAVHARLGAPDTPTETTGMDGALAGEHLALLGTAPRFRQAVELARKVAATDASVFITGESGSGKEMIAQLIHRHSRRANRPFLAVNCAALPEGLLESEMFGHRKGAFTGAVRDKAGLLEAAHQGTLLLDELVEMSTPIQAKLLRVIQDGVVRRVGSETTDAIVDVRFIAATNGDVEAAVQEGVLRKDLYYRLRVVPIHVPPLRERPEDIPLLARHFLATYWSRHRASGTSLPELSDAALRALQAHPWRGNVRELQNVIEHVAVIGEPGAEVGEKDLLLGAAEPDGTAGDSATTLLSTLADGSYHAARDRLIEQFERHYLTRLVARADGNMAQAARLAGVDRTTLYRMMERHGLHRARGTSWVSQREEASPADGAAPGATESREEASYA